MIEIATKKEPKKYKCKVCGSTNVKTEPVGKRDVVGVYCQECDAWVSWVSLEEGNLLNKEIAKNGNSYIRLVKRGQITVAKCAKCNCYLNTIGLPVPSGQFNIARAKFCPNCGARIRSK